MVQVVSTSRNKSTNDKLSQDGDQIFLRNFMKLICLLQIVDNKPMELTTYNKSYNNFWLCTAPVTCELGEYFCQLLSSSEQRQHARSYLFAEQDKPCRGFPKLYGLQRCFPARSNIERWSEAGTMFGCTRCCCSWRSIEIPLCLKKNQQSVLAVKIKSWKAAPPPVHRKS